LTRTKEAVELIRLLLSGKVAEYDGEEFRWSKQCYMRYKPVRSRIPVYIGGQGDKMLEFSGAAGDGALPILYPPDFADYAVKKISEGARKAGRDPRGIDIAGCVWMSIARDREAAVINPLKELIAYFGPLLGVKGVAAAGLTHEEFVPIHETFEKKGLGAAVKLVTPKMLRLAIHGSVDDCVAELEKLEKAGVNQVLIGAPLGPNPKESINIIGKEIIPHFSSNRTTVNTL